MTVRPEKHIRNAAMAAYAGATYLGVVAAWWSYSTGEFYWGFFLDSLLLAALAALFSWRPRRVFGLLLVGSFAFLAVGHYGFVPGAWTIIWALVTIYYLSAGLVGSSDLRRARRTQGNV